MKQMYLAAIFLMFAAAGVANAQTTGRPSNVVDVRDYTQIQGCVRGMRVEMPQTAIDVLSDDGERYVVEEATRRFCALSTRPTISLTTTYDGPEEIVVPKATAGTQEDVRVRWRIRLAP